jgi:hypothetical protein
MALNNVGDIITEVLVRNNRTTTDGFITDTIIQGWLKAAHIWAAGYKKWPMTEGKSSTSSGSATTSAEGYTTLAYPEGFKADSIRLLTVGGKRFQKKNFYKFQSFVEDNSSDTSKVYTDYARQLLINPNASDFSGTVVMWGQYMPILDVTDMTAKTIFSDYDEEGNEGIVKKMTSYLKDREHLPTESVLFDKQASDKLDAVKGLINDEQSNYLDTLNDGMWKRFDVTRGGFKEDIFRRDQWGL